MTIATDRSDNALSNFHRKMLVEQSAIGEDIILARGYSTLTKKGDLARLGFGKNQQRIPGLLMPLHSVRGAIEGYVVRSDAPRVKGGKVVKYETPGGSVMLLDVHPCNREKLADPTIPLFITEGVKKADSGASKGLCTIALLGVWNWRGRNGQGGLTALADWESIALNQRRTYIVFDSDVMTKPAVYSALVRLKKFLESRLADVSVIYLPSGLGGVKQGLDDYFATGWDVDDLLGHARQDLLTPPDSDEVDPDREAREGEKLSDVGNATRLLERHGADIRFCYLWRKWFAWDGRRWTPDGQSRVERFAKNTARSLFDDVKKAANPAELAAFAKKSLDAPRLEAMLKVARCEVEVKPDALDHAPWSLNCLNATVDLKSGAMRPHRREDLLTKLVPTEYDPAAKCPVFESFLARIMGGNLTMVAYIKRVFGYGITTSVKEDALFFCYGTGANGKTTLFNAIRDALGPDYSHECAPELLLSKKGEAHPTEVADLWGRRIVTTIEVEQGRKLAEVMVKKLTGRDPLTARRMREDFWSFEPTHKIFLAANYKPIIEGTDTAIWRRIRLIPFSVTIPKSDRDTELGAKLKAERKGILSWLVEGCREWLETGLADPHEVLAATEQYRGEMDVLSNFIADCCIIDPHVKARPTDIYNAYLEWHKSSDGGDPMSQKAFGTALGNHGYQSQRDSSSRWWKGIAVLDLDGLQERRAIREEANA